MSKIVGYGVLGIVIIISVYVLVPAQHGNPVDQAQSSRAVIHLTDSFSVLGNPTISADRIDAILHAANSPAQGTGAALYQDGVNAGIDPIFALAFFHHESSYGKYGVAAVSRGLGNIRCTEGYHCVDGYRAYASWQQGYQDWYDLISQLYVKQLGLTTVDQILPVYAPPSENSTDGYIAALKADITAWRA